MSRFIASRAPHEPTSQPPRAGCLLAVRPTWHILDARLGRGRLVLAVAAAGCCSSLPVTPDAVQQLHEGEWQVQTQEEEQIPRGFVREDWPENEICASQATKGKSEASSPLLERELVLTRQDATQANQHYITDAWLLKADGPLLLQLSVKTQTNWHPDLTSQWIVRWLASRLIQISNVSSVTQMGKVGI